MEPEEVGEQKRGGDPDEAHQKQRSGDGAKERPGVQTPQTETSGADQAAGAAALQNTIILGKVAGNRPLLEHPRRTKQEEPQPPGPEHPGTSGGTRRRSPPDRSVPGEEAARREGDRRPRLRRGSDADRDRCNAKDNAMEMQ